MGAPSLYLTVLVVSTCGLVYELLAGAAATYLLGDSMTWYAAVIGIHLSAMGVGAALTRHVEGELARRFVETQLAAALAGGATVPVLQLSFAVSPSVRAALCAMVAVTGALVGAGVPLVLRLLRRRVSVSALVSRVLALEYAGALIGALLLSFVAIPRLGVLRAGLTFGAVHALAAWWSIGVFADALPDAGALRAKGVLVLAALGLGLGFSERITRLSDEAVSPGEVLMTRQTAYQRMVVTRGHGGYQLYLDGNLQFSSSDEHRYHEALVHPAMAVARSRERALVLGGGDGLAARELLRYPDLRSLTLVDLDPGMTSLARDAPWLRGLNRDSLRDPRVRVINADAMVWLNESRRDAYDVVVVDFPDPNNFALGKLYTLRFYRLLREALAPGGVAAVQATSPFVARRSYWCVVSTMEAAGLSVRPYHQFVPSFGLWGFAMASREGLAAPRPLPAGLRSLTDEGMASMTRFPADMGRVPSEVNRLDNQVLVRLYEDEWRRWMR